MSKPLPPPEHLLELMCWICLKPFQGTGKKHNRICNRPRCAHIRNVISGILRRERDASPVRAHCQFCDAPRAEDSKYCDRHQYLRAPCPTCGGTCACGGRVRRNEGQGNQPHHCCRKCRRRAAERLGRPRARHQEQEGERHP